MATNFSLLHLNLMLFLDLIRIVKIPSFVRSSFFTFHLQNASKQRLLTVLVDFQRKGANSLISTRATLVSIEKGNLIQPPRDQILLKFKVIDCD